MEWLLHKKELDKLTLNKYLLEQPYTLVPVKQVINQLGWSKYLVMHYGQELIDDIERLSPNAQSYITFDASNQHFIVQSGHTISLHDPTLDYLNRSPKYHMLLALFLENFQSVEDFAAQHDFSTPYVRDELRELAEHLAQQHILVTDSFTLNGNEKDIRYFFFRILFDYYYQQANPLTPDAQNWAAQLFDTLSRVTGSTITPAMRVVMQFQLGLWYTRIKHGHIISLTDSTPVLRDLADLPGENAAFPITLMNTLKTLLGLDIVAAHDETRFALSALYAFGFARKHDFMQLMPTQAVALFSVINDCIRVCLPRFLGNPGLLTSELMADLVDDLYTSNLRLVYFHSELRPEPNITDAFHQFPIYAELTMTIIKEIVNQTKLPFETVRNTLFEDYFNTFITRIPREDALPLVTIALDFVDNEALKRRLIQRLQGFLSINIFITDTQITTADLVISNIHLNYEEQQTIVLRHSPTLAELNEIRRTVKEITIAKFERFTGQTISII